MITIEGIVDTFTVSTSHAATGGPAMIGVPFTMTAFLNGRLLDLGIANSAAVCVTPLSVIAAVGREVLVALPVPLAPLAEWIDSAATVTCRAALPVAARSVRRSTASWVSVPPGWSRHAGDAAFEVSSLTTTTVSGQGRVAGRQIELGGQGQGNRLLYVDPELGVLLGGTGNGSTRIVLDAGSQRQEFVQTVHQQITLLP